MTLNECLSDVRAAVKEAQEKGSHYAVIDRRTLIFLEAYIDETTMQLENVRTKIKSMINELQENKNDTTKSD